MFYFRLVLGYLGIILLAVGFSAIIQRLNDILYYVAKVNVGGGPAVAAFFGIIFVGFAILTTLKR